MRRLLKIRASLAFVVILTAAMALPAWSDTLALRDGTIISGSLVGANQDTLTFRDRNGQTRRYSVRDVEAVQFGDAPYRSSREDYGRPGFGNRGGGNDRFGDRGNGRGVLVCLNPGAGSLDRNMHYNWARSYPNEIRGNMTTKMDILFRCPNIEFDQLTTTFADISVIIPRYVDNTSCFGAANRFGALNPDWSFHKNWANGQRQADEIRRNLVEKTDRALSCVDSSRRADLFADISLALARGAYQ